MIKPIICNSNLHLQLKQFLFPLTFFVTISNLLGHSLGEGYVFLNVFEKRIEGRVEMTLADLNEPFGLDKDKDGKVSETEMEAQLAPIKAYVKDRLKFRINEKILEYQLTTHSIMRVSNAKYLLLNFKINVTESIPDNLGMEYSLLFDSDPNQRGLIVVEKNYKTGIVNNNEKVSLIFTPSKKSQLLDLTMSSWLKQGILFIGQGIWHIWIGIDHILFIITLILISVVFREKGKWEGVSDFKKAIFTLLKIVTLFTVAHSLTLCLAAMGFVQLSSRVVESIIAFSIVIAAINNIFPFFGRWDWLIIFGFGLFHGLGFASVLGHLIYSTQSLVIALLGFNIGVEIGQIAIVCVAFPIFFLLRHKKFYSPIFITSGSIIIGIISLIWFVERAFEMDSFLPF